MLGFFKGENREDLRKQHSGKRRTQEMEMSQEIWVQNVLSPVSWNALILWSLLLRILIPEKPPLPPLVFYNLFYPFGRTLGGRSYPSSISFGFSWEHLVSLQICAARRWLCPQFPALWERGCEWRKRTKVFFFPKGEWTNMAWISQIGFSERNGAGVSDEEGLRKE